MGRPEAASNSPEGAIQAEIRAEMEQMGGEAAIREQIGIGVEELSRHIEYGDYSGTLWEATKRAFSDPDDPCPVGKGLMKAYSQGGIDGERGVQEKLQALDMLSDSGFDSSITGQTREVEMQRQIRSESNEEQPPPPDDIDPPTPQRLTEADHQKAITRENHSESNFAESSANTVDIRLTQAVITIAQVAERQTVEAPESVQESPSPTDSIQKTKIQPAIHAEHVTNLIPVAETVTETAFEPVELAPSEKLQKKLIIADVETAVPAPTTRSVEVEVPDPTSPILADTSPEPVAEVQPSLTHFKEVISEFVQAQEISEISPVEALPEPAPIIAQQIAEIMPSEELKSEEQVESVVEAMPETVQGALVEYFERAEPEQAETVAELVVQIAVVAERLHVLAETGELESREASEIREVLAVWYEELMVHLDIEVDDEAFTRFIENICHEGYGQSEIADEVIHWEQGTRERKIEGDEPQQADIFTHLRRALGRLSLSRTAIA